MTRLSRVAAVVTTMEGEWAATGHCTGRYRLRHSDDILPHHGNEEILVTFWILFGSKFTVIFFEKAWTPDLPISWKVFKVSILGGGLYPLSPMSSPAPPLQTCRGHKKFVLNAFLSEAVYVRREGKDLQDPKDFLLRAGQVLNEVWTVSTLPPFSTSARSQPRRDSTSPRLF